jgi:hypothetical protein
LSWYLCTIASNAKENWRLCIDSKTWGIITTNRYSSGDRARKGDQLLFWLAGTGYVGFGEVSQDTRPPLSSSEVPWQGGQERFGLVIPLVEIIEFESPILLKFITRKQQETQIDQSMFQRGFMPINDSAANLILSKAKKLL